MSHPTSTDDVTNGLALCRLHHGAYDNALLGVQSDYQIVINHERSDRLREIGMDTWLPHFQRALPARFAFLRPLRRDLRPKTYGWVFSCVVGRIR